MVSAGMNRREAVAELLAADPEALVITGLGSPAYDVHAAGDADRSYYLWGAMGGAALMGFGLAQAQPEKRVMVITGDGEMLMALGALATITISDVRNLDIIVLDNGHYGETGMQMSHTGRGVDLAAVASAAGFPETGVLSEQSEVAGLCKRLAEPAKGPRLFVLKVKAEPLPRRLPSRDATYIKNRFRAHLGLAPN